MKLKKIVISIIIILISFVVIVSLSGLSFVIPIPGQVNIDKQNNINQGIYQRQLAPMDNFFLTTRDNIRISTNIYEVENPIGWIVFSHMLSSTKESWHDLAIKLQKLGYESLAIDLRGHGDSIRADKHRLSEDKNELTRKLDHRDFSNEKHQKSILDIETAVRHLKFRGATPDKISFIGASIGANLSLQYISENPEFRTAILLSPGLNYKGIKSEPMVKKLKDNQRVLFISSRDDGPNVEHNQKLFNSTPAEVEKDLIIYENAGHGTDMLTVRQNSDIEIDKEKPDIKKIIIQFLKQPIEKVDF